MSKRETWFAVMWGRPMHDFNELKVFVGNGEDSYGCKYAPSVTAAKRYALATALEHDGHVIEYSSKPIADFRKDGP